jgi:branched-chain amino acid transport system ATP-binding protein
LLNLNDVWVHYGRVAAVQGLNLTVEEGQLVGLVGNNGAGKTTTLSTIAGVRRPSKGEIVFEGKRIDGSAPDKVLRRGLSLVPENRRIFQRLSVAENLQIGTSGRGDRAEARRDIDEMYERFPVLARYRDTPGANLSGGEQQQLAIARALLSRPRLLLLDEPSLGLAPLLVNLVFDAIKTLREDGVTILLAEQFVTKTLAVADRVYALSRGRVAISGTPAALRAAGDFDTNYLLGLRAPKDGAA